MNFLAWIIGEDLLVYWAGQNGISKILVISLVVLAYIYRVKILATFKTIGRLIGL